MGEAILIKALGGAGGSGSTEAGDVATEGLLTVNGTYTCTKTGNYLVCCVGGGGGAGQPWYDDDNEKWYNGDPGVNGGINYSNLYMIRMQTAEVTIGAAGKFAYAVNANNPWQSGGTGGSTSFGTMLVANGGTGGKADRSGGSNSKPMFVWHNNYLNFTASNSAISGFTRLNYGDGRTNKAGNKGCVSVIFLD